MKFQSHQALQQSGSFEEFPSLVSSAIEILPYAGPMFAVVIIIGISIARVNIINKQDNAEEKRKISLDDKSKYSPQDSNNSSVSSDTTVSSSNSTISSNNTTISSSNNNISPSDAGGVSPGNDFSSILKRYIDDLYRAGIEGDTKLRESGLGELVDNNQIPSVDEAVRIFAEFMSNF